MGGAWKATGALVAIACAVALTACGGGGSSSSTESTTAGQPPATTTAEAGGKEAGGGKEGGKEGGGGANTQGNGAGSGGGSESGWESHSSKERSAGFRNKGGDNSIQSYGGEANAEERAAATRTISTFFAAQRAGQWAKVCGVLSAKNLEQLEAFAKRLAKVKKNDCAGVLELLNANAPSQRPPETIKGGVVSLRREGDSSFALYHGIDGKNYALPLTLEGGQWKLTSLGATPLSY
jgi:hypothetical protein